MFWKGYHIADLLLVKRVLFLSREKKGGEMWHSDFTVERSLFYKSFLKVLGLSGIDNRSSVGVSANSIFYLNL